MRTPFNFNFNYKRSDTARGGVSGYGIFNWKFNMLDTNGVRVGGWTYYCFSEMAYNWLDSAVKVNAVPDSETAKARRGHLSTEDLHSYFELFDHLFGDLHTMNVDDLITELTTTNGYTVPLNQPGTVGYGCAVIIRYLWEDPRIVRNFLLFRKAFPDHDIGRIFILSHMQSFLEYDGFANMGHAFFEGLYGRGAKISRVKNYFNSFKDDTKPATETKRWAGLLSGCTENWYNNRDYSVFIEDENARMEHAKKILEAA